MQRFTEFSKKYYLLEYTTAIVSWGLETVGFVLLPLIVYLVIFYGLRMDLHSLIELPEWMFISVLLFGTMIKEQVSFFKNWSNFETIALFAISIGVLGIVVSAVFLTFSTIAQYRENFSLSDDYYRIQLVVFILSLFWSVSSSILLTIGGIRKSETLRKLQDIPQKTDLPSNRYSEPPSEEPTK